MKIKVGDKFQFINGDEREEVYQVEIVKLWTNDFNEVCVNFRRVYKWYFPLSKPPILTMSLKGFMTKIFRQISEVIFSIEEGKVIIK